MITWPPASIFPPPDVSFGAAVSANAIRTKMDSGRIRQRKRFTKNMRQISANWKLTDDQRSLFQGLFSGPLNNGADWFSMSLPLNGGFKTFTVRFVADSYSEKYDGFLHWNTSAKLETEDFVESDNAELSEAYEAIGWDVDAFASAVAALTEITEL